MTPCDRTPAVPLVDLRGERVALAPKVRLRGKGRPWVRDPRDVTGITVHQTAVEYGVTPAQTKASGGNRQLALARRALGVACHALAFRDGFFAAPTPLTWHVNHGNGLNSTTLGLEIDGRYPGLRDDPTTQPRREDLATTWGGEPSAVTETIVDAARAALRWLVEEGRREGLPIEWVWAHRQSSRTRRSDPGAELWGRVVEEYAIPVLGLRCDHARTWGEGRPIPVAWSPRGTGAY